MESARSGWATQGGGTTGGAAAGATAIYKINSARQLLDVLKAEGDKPKIIKLYGTVDMAGADNGGPFRSAADQKARIAVKLGGNTTLIGLGADARLLNASVSIKGVDNVIVRNLTIVNPCDIDPQWDSQDGGGNWNSEYDGLVIDGSTRVWVDHNVFTDAPQTDAALPVVNGKLKQCHDGALDVKNGADYVTVSNNVFDQHSKNTLVGSSDNATEDNGHLRVTFHGNHYLHIASRTPRVRFGRVHLYNNFHEGSREAQVYAHEYSIGVGYQAKIISQNNVFDVAGATGCAHIVKNPGSDGKAGAILDSGSLVNGSALNLSSACRFSSAVGWTVPYSFTLLKASDVKSAVQAQAGVGKLSVK